MIFFDFEVFQYYWCVVIIKPFEQLIRVIDDRDELIRFYNENLQEVWCGYNVKGYDQYILKGIVLGLSPKKINDHIISGEPAWKFSSAFNKVPLIVYDCIVKRAGMYVSLKELEGHMGLNIRECSVPFNLNRPLTDEEKQEVHAYCITDVENTVRVFLNTKKSYDSTVGLLRMYKLPTNYLSKTDGQLSAIVLEANRVHGRTDEFEIELPEPLQLSKYQHIADWYLNPINQDYNKNQTEVVYGVEHEFRWGGVHAARSNYSAEGFIVTSDVASLYPSLMIEYDLLSRNVKDPRKYEEIKNLRIKLKKEKNPLQEALKLVLNTTYGVMKDRNNDMYDPLMANLVCIFGQVLILDLLEKIELKFGDKVELIQSNTDGIFVKLSDKAIFDDYKAVCDEWSNRTGLILEHEIGTKMVQKDVNNYIFVMEDGKYKPKGAYVKKISPDAMDYDLPIVNKAVVEYFVHNTPVKDTVNSCNNLMEFQKIVKVSSKYYCAIHGDEELQEKCLRVFASKNRLDRGVFKKKEQYSNKKEKIGNTPERCFIDNSNVTNKTIPDYLDKNWYIELAEKRIEDYIGKDLGQMRLW